MKIGRYKYDQEMANPRSEIFQKTAYEIESALRNIFRKQLSNFVAVRVFKLEQGSVIVSYNVHLASSSKQKSSDVQNIITTNAENGELQHLKVSGVVVTQVEDDKAVTVDQLLHLSTFCVAWEASWLLASSFWYFQR